MQSTVQFEQLVRGCVHSLMLVDDEQPAPADDADLLRGGLIDSLGVMEIVAFLEETFDIEVDDQDIVPDNFCSVAEITRYVAEKKGVAAPAGAGFETLVDGALPDGSIILVVSRGDDALLGASEHECRHFPSTETGEYAWSHPADDPDAIEQLERARAQGATHIAFPADESWWLDHYAGLRAHLDAGCPDPTRTPAGILYTLPPAG